MDDKQYIVTKVGEASGDKPLCSEDGELLVLTTLEGALAQARKVISSKKANYSRIYELRFVGQFQVERED